MSLFIELINPTSEQLGSSPEEFLRTHDAPLSIQITGKDPYRNRTLITLLHGNEPSGLRAVHRWLKMGRTPAVSLTILVPSVKAALQAPVFSHRMLPGFRDLNRCFKPPYRDSQGALAKEILRKLVQSMPEAIVDMHNTTGSGPGFAVCLHTSNEHLSLVERFCQRLVITELRLGALMETEYSAAPVVTIECGGRLDTEADEFAWDGLCRYFEEPDVLTPMKSDWQLELLRHPARLRLRPPCHLAYANHPQTDADLTLRQDIEHFNFGIVTPDTHLGWVGKNGLSVFTLSGNQRVEDVLVVREGAIYPSRPFKLFMITTNPEIALNDCLCYLVID
ncbi:succinylglutamate desuccinylase/aspartoacylase family protein [Porticoccaceae bacterium LTM1]|nr:succinylglutamate desuccinylase/aspartoacylase family protein [Porticoccaceae bacterium LTM1]